MKQRIHKAISLVMALLVITSTLSFTIDMHYCGDHLVDFSMVKGVKTCSMDEKTVVNADKTDCKVEKTASSCCSDKKFSVKGQDDLKPSFTDFHLHQQVFIASFVYTYLNLFEEEKVDFIPFKTYRPPHLTRDVHLLHESFLI